MAGISIAEMADTLAKELAGYSEQVADETKQLVRSIAGETVKKLKSSSPKASGDYAKGWASKLAFESGTDIRVQVYNRKKPQLTHLLEHGNAKANGGRVEGKPHIGPAERAAEKKLLGKIKVVVKG